MKLMDYMHWIDVTTDNLNFYKAIGVDCLMIHLPERMGDGQDHTDELKRMKKFVGRPRPGTLRLPRPPNTPRQDNPRSAGSREIETWCTILRAIGAAGVPATCTTFYAISHFRTSHTYGRGGISYSSFDYEELMQAPPHFPDKVISQEQLWENINYFLQQVVPVAEEAQVRIALHPDDPPIPEPLGGAARIMVSIKSFQRVFDLVPSDAYGMLFCQGCVAEMGEDIVKAIHAVGQRNKIVFVHFRNIRGTPHKFQEVFLDEGDMDMGGAMQAYRDVGFNGPFMMDHTPGIPTDPHGTASRAYANGYIKALIQAVYR
jgi:mannonate dehydratase